tara:strand:+ start:462 stop:1061 length:600 start_codon:yes stop_codon:yes gene_type:complete
MIYDTRFGLTQPSVDYLNQPMPDISGIFSLFAEKEDDQTTPPGLTPEQLMALYPQSFFNMSQTPGEGDDSDDDDDIDRSNNLGITSLADLRDAVFSLPGAIGFQLGNIPGLLLGRAVGDFITRETPLQKAIRKEQISDFYDRVGKGQVDFQGGISIDQDARRGGQYGGDGEGSGSNTGGQDTSGASGGAPGGGADASTY